MASASVVFEGDWLFQSFFERVGAAGETGKWDVLPWTPPGSMSVRTAADGSVTGQLKFVTSTLAIVGQLTLALPGEPPGEKSPGRLPVPPGVRLTGAGLGATYEIRGFFIAPDQIVGTSRCISGDLAKQPDGTSGPFVLGRR